jgi:hypothetical protein
MKPVSLLRLRAGLCAVLLSAAACTDRNPAALPPQAAPPGPAGAATLQCTADVRAGTLSCAAASAAAANVSAVILGGQGTNVRLASSGTSYDVQSSILRSKVTVENLTGQVLGTTNGASPSLDGIRVFFASGPTVTGGTGTVTVANADGEAVFTGAGQPYFRYVQILMPGDTSAAREWRFAVSPTVTTFVFSVYVSAPVPRETGWIAVQPMGPTLQVGDTMHLSATVRTATGRLAAGEQVAWSTANPAIATVDSLGVVTAHDTGWVDITAASGPRSGQVTVRVDPAGSLLPRATIVAFDVLTPSVQATGVDPVRFRVTMRRFTGAALNVLLGSGALGAACGATLASTEPDGDGVYECSLLFGPSFVGTWQVTEVIAPGLPERRMNTAELAAAGAPTLLNLRTPVDGTPPQLTAIHLQPDTARAGVDLVEVMAEMTDQGSGAQGFLAVFSHPQASERYACSGRLLSGTSHDGLFRCPLWVFPEYARSGTWTLDYIQVTDLAGNTRLLRRAELQAAGLRTSIQVSNPDPDLTPPDITAFSFTPAAVKGNGIDSVLVTLSATDARSRVWFLDMEFENAAKTQTRRCLLNTAAQPGLTMTCAQRFTAADVGAWHVLYIRAIDLNGNQRVLFTEDLPGAGYPTALTVTP